MLINIAKATQHVNYTLELEAGSSPCVTTVLCFHSFGNCQLQAIVG